MTDPDNNEKLRREYRGGILDEEDLSADPHDLFEQWFSEAVEADIDLPDAMTLSTVDREGTPSARMVLLKEYGKEGFIFYTDYRSRKGKELSNHPEAALTLYWRELDRQVRIRGRVEKVSREKSKIYFKKRPRESQLAAHASTQDEILSDREELEERYRKLENKYDGKEVPLPENWGGFRLIPAEFIFWQGRPGRLHDRFRYLRAETNSDEWNIHRLSP